MHVGIVSPCSSGPLADLLSDSREADLGCGAHFVATLVRALIGRGHRVSVITLSPEISLPTILRGPELTYYVYPQRTQKRMRDLYKIERQGLSEGIRLAQPNLLHAHWTYEFALACLETGLPTLVTSHDNAVQVLRYARDLYRLGRLYLQIRVIKRAHFLTAVSPYLADSLHWIAGREIPVIPNAIDFSNDSGSKISCDPTGLKIATVLNGWGRLKNPKAAIGAFNLVRRQLPNTELYMYGHDYEPHGLASRWAHSEGLNENIHFCGFVPPRELQKSLRNVSMLLHPALEEACPLTLIESMALGLPVIAGEGVGGVPWVLDEGRAGFLTDVRDPECIAHTLFQCIEHPETRRKKQVAARERAALMFSPNSVAEQYEKMYENILSS